MQLLTRLFLDRELPVMLSARVLRFLRATFLESHLSIEVFFQCVHQLLSESVIHGFESTVYPDVTRFSQSVEEQPSVMGWRLLRFSHTSFAVHHGWAAGTWT